MLKRGQCLLNLMTKRPPLFGMLPIRCKYESKLWVTYNERPEWTYMDAADLMNVELANAIGKLEPNKNVPWLILDVREESERDYMDLPKYNKVSTFLA